VRASYATAIDRIVEAASRIADFVKSLPSAVSVG
jgi:hypothetical protein